MREGGHSTAQACGLEPDARIVDHEGLMVGTSRQRFSPIDIAPAGR
jgi:hypothetical protein